VKKGILIAIAVSVVLSLPFFGTMWNLFMHIFGAILFMGNIIVTAAWFSMARRSGSGGALQMATRAVVVADVMFTLPGSLLLLLNGGILGTEFFKAGASWVFASLGLFFVSAIIWVAVLVPLQRRMVLVAQSEPTGPEMTGLMAKWFRFGGIATLLPLITLVLMVTKPDLW
jgi:uncharacterized membrane protein